jgi:hypothetical protein
LHTQSYRGILGASGLTNAAERSYSAWAALRFLAARFSCLPRVFKSEPTPRMASGWLPAFFHVSKYWRSARHPPAPGFSI